MNNVLTKEKIEKVTKKLLDMCKEEQDIRGEFFRTGDQKDLEKVVPVDKRNREEFKKIFAEVGYISKEYGKEAQRSAFLIVQHMPKEELSFRKKYACLMKKDLKNIGSHRYAMIVDRNRTYEGKPQLYGTQFMAVDGKKKTAKLMDIYKIEELDIRRKRIGLGSIQEEIDMAKKVRGVTFIL